MFDLAGEYLKHNMLCKASHLFRAAYGYNAMGSFGTRK